MKHLSTIMAFFISTICFAQAEQHTPTLDVIEQLINPDKRTDTIIYISVLEAGLYDDLKKKFINKNGKFFNQDSEDGDTLMLTKGEINYIIKQLDSAKDHIWKEDVFLHSKIIAIDSVWDYLAKPYYKRLEVHIFSKPIFLRDNSICVFYHMHFIGSGGPDYFGFVKIKNEKWKEWIMISGGYLN